MSTTTTPCWACSYSDSKDQAKCWVCSPSPSSPSSSRAYITSPSTADLRWSMPAISTAKLQKVWQRCGSEVTQEWREALDLIRLLNPKRLCAPSEKTNLLPGQSPPTILLQDGDYFENTPKIILTSASPTEMPTMNITTWHTFGQSVWSTSDVHVTTMEDKQKKHKGKRQNCKYCKMAAEVNRKWAEAMAMDKTKEKAKETAHEDYTELQDLMKNLSLQENKERCNIRVVMPGSWIEVNT